MNILTFTTLKTCTEKFSLSLSLPPLYICMHNDIWSYSLQNFTYRFTLFKKVIHSSKVSKFIFCSVPWCWAHRHRFWFFCSSTCCLLRKSLQLLLQTHPNWSYLGTKPRDSQRGSIPLSTCKCPQRKCWAFWEETMLRKKSLSECHIPECGMWHSESAAHPKSHHFPLGHWEKTASFSLR